MEMSTDQFKLEMAKFVRNHIHDPRDDELASLRSQLNALQAEAARVVGPFAALAGPLVDQGASTAIGLTDDHFLAARAFLSSLPSPAVVGTFQARVHDWIIACFGEEIGRDQVERNHRFLEESLELVQSLGCTVSEAHQLVDYVYGREIGEPNQEVGGVMNTLAALCTAAGLDMAGAGETELARVWTKVEKIRAKQAAKPKHSPLPMAVAPAVVAVPVAPGEGDVEALEDIRTHAHLWLKLLAQARDSAPSSTEDFDDKGYYQHEIDVLNAIVARAAYRALVKRHGW